MKVYQLRVSIIGIPKIYRVIEASENCTFDDLHETIFNAFNRYDPHLYSFFMTKKDTKSIHSIYEAPEITHPQNVEDIMGFGRKKKSTAKTRIGDVGLDEKDVFHYLFGFVASTRQSISLPERTSFISMKPAVSRVSLTSSKV
jgi:hypothetical protein